MTITVSFENEKEYVKFTNVDSIKIYDIIGKLKIDAFNDPYFFDIITKLAREYNVPYTARYSTFVVDTFDGVKLVAAVRFPGGDKFYHYYTSINDLKKGEKVSVVANGRLCTVEFYDYVKDTGVSNAWIKGRVSE
jgi:hypothetical protein